MKKILLIILVMFPIVINGDCNYDEVVLAGKLAKEVNYETNYNSNNGKFDITVYNVVDLLYLEYSNKLYYGNSKGEVIIKGVDQGKTISISVKANVADCNYNLQNKHITLPYYNGYFGSEICEGYEMLTPCASEFLSYKNNTNIIKSAISNYEGALEPDKKDEDNKKLTIIEQIIVFGKNWGIKILLALVTTVLSILFFKSYFRKVKHGI